MEISNSVLFNQGFTDAINSLLDLKLPISKSLSIAKTIQDIENQRDIVYKVRDKIISRYGDDRTEEQNKEINTSINDMINEKFKLDMESKIKLPKTSEISVKDALLLIDIIESEE